MNIMLKITTKHVIRTTFKKCNNVIESKSVHDFVTCPCGNLSVDGGLDYARRVFNGNNKSVTTWEDLSEYEFREG